MPGEKSPKATSPPSHAAFNFPPPAASTVTPVPPAIARMTMMYSLGMIATTSDNFSEKDAN